MLSLFFRIRRLLSSHTAKNNLTEPLIEIAAEKVNVRFVILLQIFRRGKEVDAFVPKGKAHGLEAQVGVQASVHRTASVCLCRLRSWMYVKSEQRRNADQPH